MLNKHKKIFIVILDVFLILSPLILKSLAFLMFKIPFKCPFWEAGYMCPSCGGTRSVYAFFGGDFIESFSYNPFIFMMIIYIITFIIFFNIGIFLNKSFAKTLYSVMINPKIIIVLAILFAVFGILRNFF